MHASFMNVDEFQKTTDESAKSAIFDHIRSPGIDKHTRVRSPHVGGVLAEMASETGWHNTTTTWNATEAEFNVDEYLQLQLGHRYRNFGESVSLIVVYCLIFLTGVVGNLCTCLVIIRNKRMHTATNYYLFSLAVSDLLTLLLGLPPELYTVVEAYPWRFGTAYCLFKTFLTEMTSSASILTIAAFTIERYLAICHSLRTQATSGLSRAVRCVIVVWIVACLTSVVYPIHTRTFYYVTDPRSTPAVTSSAMTSTGGHDMTMGNSPEPLVDSLICTIPEEWMSNMRYAFQVSTFLLFVLPMILITVLYVRIGIALRQSAIAAGLRVAPPARWTSGNAGGATNGGEKTTNSRQTRHVLARSNRSRVAQSRKSIFKMLIAVVMAFFVCWAPYHAQRLMTIYNDQWTPTWLEIHSHLFYISGVLYYVAATVNPILYNVMSHKYRQSFKTTLCYRCQDDEARQRLRRSGFGASTAYFSAVASAPTGPGVSGARAKTSAVAYRRCTSTSDEPSRTASDRVGAGVQTGNSGNPSTRSNFTQLSSCMRAEPTARSSSSIGSVPLSEEDLSMRPVDHAVDGDATLPSIGDAPEVDRNTSMSNIKQDGFPPKVRSMTVRSPLRFPEALSDVVMETVDACDADILRETRLEWYSNGLRRTPKLAKRSSQPITYVELVNVEPVGDQNITVQDDRTTEHRKSTLLDESQSDSVQSKTATTTTIASGLTKSNILTEYARSKRTLFLQPPPYNNHSKPIADVQPLSTISCGDTNPQQKLTQASGRMVRRCPKNVDDSMTSKICVNSLPPASPSNRKGDGSRRPYCRGRSSMVTELFVIDESELDDATESDDATTIASCSPGVDDTSPLCLERTVAVT